MEVTKVDELVAVVSSVATYGGQIATVFHNYSLVAKVLPRDFAGANNILNASTSTLKQLLTLLATSNRESERVHLFSEEGLEYVKLIVFEIATILTKIQPAVEEACLSRPERRKLQRQKRRAETRNNAAILDPLTLKLDEQVFLERVEKTNWNVAIDDLSEHIPRLYELQLLVLLVFQVGTVAKLSKDV